MTRSSCLLCALYLATSAQLAWTAVLELRFGPPWAAALFGAASLVPVIAVVRETVLADERRAAGRPAGRPRPAHRADEAVVRAELDTACCERWWTSCGTGHDTGCVRRARRSSTV
ncbi:hypothetical protein [Streptomyces sp. NPDC005876]|jgi:hypothetical protein|uniref:hypothetical protein n=1 Tax=unclassified Streptomyces TaxID=2593676 RepID=UPI0033DD3204